MQQGHGRRRRGVRGERAEEKATGRGGHECDQEVELTISVASLGATVARADHERRKKNSAEVRKEETVTVSGVGDGRLVVGMDTCGGAGGGFFWWLERRRERGREKLQKQGQWRLVFCQLWTRISPPSGNKFRLYL